ncbi:MAG: purple acid phosphatase family protein, partial [Actinomycetota bacterium]
MSENFPAEGYAYARALIPARLRRGMRTAEDFYEYTQARVSRRAVLKGFGLAGLAVAAGPILWSKPGYAAEPPQGTHITYGDDPMRQMHVSWFTEANVAKPSVEYGPTPAYGAMAAAESTTYKSPEQGEQISIQHHATVRGLEPGRTYHYRVRHDGGTSADFVFATAPGKIVPFTFTSFGDHGSDPNGSPGRASWGTAFSPLAVAAVERVNPAFHVHNGDISYSCGGPQEAWDAWAAEVQPRASKMPWMVALGNHEMELSFGPNGYEPFRSRFRLPRNGVDWTPERASTFYAFQYSNVLVVMLDGNEAASENGYHFNRGYLRGAQDRWLEGVLKAGRASPTVDWILASFHNCMFCTDAVHGSDGGCRARWLRLFEKYQVDVVLNGHNHTYERTYPIRSGAHTTLSSGQPAEPGSMGVTYVCAGGGGQLALPRSASTYPNAPVHDEQGRLTTEPALWRAARVEQHTIATFAVDPGTVGGKTRLTLSTHEFVTPAFAEVDRVVFERPAKAVAANLVRPPARVGGTRTPGRQLPATGVGAGIAAG